MQTELGPGQVLLAAFSTICREPGQRFPDTAPVPALLFLTRRGKDRWRQQCGCIRKCGVSQASYGRANERFYECSQL